MASASDSKNSTTSPKKASKPISPLSNLQPKGFPALPAGWTSEADVYDSSSRGEKIFAAVYSQENPALAHVGVLVVHGQGEHGGRYLHFPHFLQKEVGTVFCPDHRGHGRSEGSRGHIDRFHEYVDDLKIAYERLHDRLMKRAGRAQIHLVGHSMGGLIGLRFLFAHPSLALASATISAPLLGLRVPVPVVQKGAAYVLSYVWGSLLMSSTLDPNLISRDPAVVEAYTSDLLVHNKVSPRFFTELEAVMSDTLSKVDGITVPVLAIVPEQDQIVDPEASKRFFDQLKIAHKKVVKYPDFRHEPFNELGKEKVFEEVSAWIREHS